MRGLVRAVAHPERTGFDRLSDLDEDRPVIFAANHHSHVDAPLLITSIPEPWRHKLVVGAAADYFFATRMTGALSALAMGAIPIDRTRVQPQVRRSRRGADRGRLEHPDLPRGRPESRRLGPAVPRRCGLPLRAHRGAGRPDPSGRHRPHHGQGDEPPAPGTHARDVRQADATTARRRRAVTRLTDRDGGVRAGRRERDRLVVGTTSRGATADTRAHRARRTVVAARMGARRSQGPDAPAEPRLARPRLSAPRQRGGAARTLAT